MRAIFLFVSICLIHVASFAADYRDKLDLQFSKFDRAQEILVERMRDEALSDEERIISRDEWEGLLFLGVDGDWTSADLKSLRADQMKRIETAKVKASIESKFDLTKIRKDKASVAKFCAELPKGAMLHIHPSGTLKPATALALLSKLDPLLDFNELLLNSNNAKYGTILYPGESEWLKARGPSKRFSVLNAEEQAAYLNFFVLPEGSHPFERFESVFNFISTAYGDNKDVEFSWLEFAKRAADQKVIYVEFTNGVNKQSAPSVAAMIDRVERESGVMIRYNRAFPRTAPVSHLRSEMNDLLKMPKYKWLVGIDLLSNETNAPTFEKAQEVYGTLLALNLEGKSDLHRTMHAGELGAAENPRDAILLGVERIGHGVKLWDDAVALEYAIKKNIAIETNLSSNIKLKAVSSLKEHPFLNFLRLGLPVSLSTDDEGIFDTDINHECELAVANTDVTFSEMKKMSINGIETSFASPGDKKLLIEKLKKQFSEFEQKLAM